MAIELHILDAPGRLRAYREQLRHVFDDVVLKVRRLLPIADVDVVMQVLPQLTVMETGVGGYSPSADVIFLYLNPQHRCFEESITTEVAPTLAHELYHCTRWLGPGYGATLGEALVSEGLALHFETQFREAPPFYATALSEAELQPLLHRAMRQLGSTAFVHREWFFGSSRKHIPRYAGYTLGFHLVGKALKELGKPVHEVKDRPAAEFLKLAIGARRLRLR